MSDKEPLSTEPYKGVRDFYPADWALLSAAFNQIREVLAGWGYEEYQASPLERTELYESKTSEEIVSEQSYTFEDRGGRRVTIRPEMTPTLARMIAAKRREMPFPVRWFSIGNRFRYERPQKGRLREFYQTDVDFVGLPAGEADIEVVQIAANILRSFGATDADFTIRMSSRVLLNAACEAAGLSGESVKAYTRLLDRKAKMPGTEFAAAVAEITNTDPLALIEANDERIAPQKAELMNMIDELVRRGVTNAVFDPTITRGFDYYTGMVFEVNDTDAANPRALMGGGRYDGLVALFGGDNIPAVGFAFGDVTLLDFLETHGLTPESASSPQIFIGTPSPEDRTAARVYASTLRDQGVRVFLNLTDKSLGDQVKEADRRGIPYFVAYGANEEAANTIKVKVLAESREEVLEKDSVASFLKK
jgi:histidyl-tRNA synthetase